MPSRGDFSEFIYFLRSFTFSLLPDPLAANLRPRAIVKIERPNPSRSYPVGTRCRLLLFVRLLGAEHTVFVRKKIIIVSFILSI